MKNIGTRVLYSSVLLLSCIVIGTVLMMAAYSIPKEAMWENVKKSVGTLEKEGTYYRVLDTVNSQLDNFTDAFMIGNVISSREKGIVDDAMSNYRISVSEMNNIQSLRAYAEHDAVGFWSYGRYWHGYLIFLKPLFTIFDYSQIRWINMSLQIMVIMLICIMLGKRNMWQLCIPLLVTYLVLCPIALMMSLQFSTIFYLTFGACLLILLFHERLNQRYYSYFFLIIGTATSYFDLLTYPMLTVLMPLTMVMVLRRKQRVAMMKPLMTMIGYGVSWGVGFLGMWFGKWCIATLLTGTDYISQSLNQILFRTSTTSASGETIALTTGLQKSIGALLTPPVPLILLAAFGACLVFGIKRYTCLDCRIENVYPYALIAVVPVLWLLITCNHSSIHYWFTFRNLAASVFAVLIGLLAQFGSEAVDPCNDRTDKRLRSNM